MKILLVLLILLNYGLAEEKEELIIHSYFGEDFSFTQKEIDNYIKRVKPNIDVLDHIEFKKRKEGKIKLIVEIDSIVMENQDEEIDSRFEKKYLALLVFLLIDNYNKNNSIEYRLNILSLLEVISNKWWWPDMKFYSNMDELLKVKFKDFKEENFKKVLIIK